MEFGSITVADTADALRSVASELLAARTGSVHAAAPARAINFRRLVCRERSIVRGDGGRFTTPPPSRLEARSRLGLALARGREQHELGVREGHDDPSRWGGTSRLHCRDPAHSPWPAGRIGR
jgi:hypothetical protein